MFLPSFQFSIVIGSSSEESQLYCIVLYCNGDLCKKRGRKERRSSPNGDVHFVEIPIEVQQRHFTAKYLIR